MDKFYLAEILDQALKRYSMWEYAKVAILPDESLIESTAEGTPTANDSYWQIEIRPLQKWSAGTADVIQLFAEITDGQHFIGAVIEYSSAGNTLMSDEFVEYIDGVARPLATQGHPSGSPHSPIIRP